MISYRESELGTEFVDPIGFQDMSNVTPEIIISNMERVCKSNNIPASFSECMFVDGGAGSFLDSIAYGKKPSLFKLMKKVEYKAIQVSHPNPPQQYCDQLYIILNDGIRVFFVGESKAFKEKNYYEQGIGLKNKLRAFAGIRREEDEAYNIEMEWHSTIYAAFVEICEQE